MATFKLVNTQFPSGGFGLTNSFPPTASIFPLETLSSQRTVSPPVDFHVENSLSEFEWENVFSPGNFDPTNVDDVEDFQLSREESDLRFGPSLTSKEVDHAIRDRIPEKTRRSTQWAVSIFRAWCQVHGVKKKVEVLSVKKLSELLPLFVIEARRQDG